MLVDTWRTVTLIISGPVEFGSPQGQTRTGGITPFPRQSRTLDYHCNRTEDRLLDSANPLRSHRIAQRRESDRLFMRLPLHELPGSGRKIFDPPLLSTGIDPLETETDRDWPGSWSANPDRIGVASV